MNDDGLLPKFSKSFKRMVSRDFTANGLRAAIIIWAVLVVILALNVQDKYKLAAILAWEVLP